MNTETDSITQSKHEVRAALLKKRTAMPMDLKHQKSEDICQQLIAYIEKYYPCKSISEASAPVTIGVYSSLKHEVQLTTFLDYAYSKNFRICFPCMHTEFVDGLPFSMRSVSRETLHRETACFVTSPIKNIAPDDPLLTNFELVKPEVFDVIIVPLVGFDQNKKRLGYGGGNYDRYLERISKSCHIIGVAFDEQYVEHVPCDAHDVSLPIIITA